MSPALLIAAGAGMAICLVACRGSVSSNAGRDYAKLAVPELEQLADQGSDAHAWRELAYRDLQRGAGDDAIARINRALEIEPGSSDGHNIRGMVYADAGNDNLAATSFRQAMELGPAKVAPQLNLGRLYLRRRQFVSAAAAFQQAGELAPDHLEATLLAGEAWFEAGSWMAAKIQYRKALAISPNEVGAHAAMGKILVNEGRFADAKQYLLAARELGDHSAETQGYLGMAYAIGIQTDADVKQGVDHLLAAKKAGERGSQIYYGLGFAYLAAHDYQAAEATLKEGLELYPDVAGLYYTMSDVYAATGRSAESRAARQKSAELAELRKTEKKFLDRIAAAPRDVGPRVEYLAWLRQRGDFDRAVPQCQTILELEPGNPEAAAGIREAAQALAEPELLQLLRAPDAQPRE